MARQRCPILLVFARCSRIPCSPLYAGAMILLILQAEIDCSVYQSDVHGISSAGVITGGGVSSGPCSYDAEQGEYTCLTVEGVALTVPCGGYAGRAGLSFSYYVPQFSGKNTVLGRDLSDFLQFNVSLESDGSYVCCQPNVSTDPMCYRMIVTYKPRRVALEWCEGMQPVYGHRFCMVCPLIGNPPAEYHWERYKYPDQTEALSLARDLLFMDEGRKWSVEFFTEDHNGLYVCYASNGLGEEQFNSQAFYLSTQGCDSPVGEPTVHTVAVGGPEHIPGANVTVNCTAASTSFSPPLSWWSVMNDTYRSVRSMSNIEVESHYDRQYCRWTSSLTIVDFDPSLAGEYMCSVGLSHNSVSLGVKECYSYSEGDVELEISPQSTQYKYGNNVTLHCTAMQVTSEQVPVWTLVPHGLPCVSNSSVTDTCDYAVSESFSEENCKWMSSLTIRNFNETMMGTYRCSVSNHSVEFIPDVTDHSGIPTTAVIILIAGAIVGVMALLIAISLILKRWNTLSWDETTEPSYDGFKYDVFISAHNEVRDIVEQRIMAPLESGCQPPYHVCWHHRDFVCGIPIMEQIANVVEQSRKVLFVFSDNFMESDFCRFELDLTLHRLITSRTRCLVPIALVEDAVPRRLRRLITYWPKVELKVDDINFVTEIGKLIGHPITRTQE